MPALPGRYSWLWQLGSVGFKMVGFLVNTNDSLSQANERNVKGAEMGHGKVFKCLKDPLEMITPPSSPAKKNRCGGGFRDDLLKKTSRSAPMYPKLKAFLRAGVLAGSWDSNAHVEFPGGRPWRTPRVGISAIFLLQGIAKKKQKNVDR